jgi:hypothetical protein
LTVVWAWVAVATATVAAMRNVLRGFMGISVCVVNSEY